MPALEPEPAKSAPAPTTGPSTTATQAPSLSELNGSTWHSLVQVLPVGGVIQNTVRNCQLLGRSGNVLQFVLDERNSTLYDESHQQRLADILSDHFAEPLKVDIQIGAVSAETPAAINARLQAERQARALSAMQNDPLVQELINTFSATLREDSVSPLDG